MEKRRVYVMSPCRQCCKDYGQTLEGGGRAQKPSHVAKLNCTALEKCPILLINLIMLLKALNIDRPY
jgi:hypothetical protein